MQWCSSSLFCLLDYNGLCLLCHSFSPPPPYIPTSSLFMVCDLCCLPSCVEVHMDTQKRMCISRCKWLCWLGACSYEENNIIYVLYMKNINTCISVFLPNVRVMGVFVSATVVGSRVYSVHRSCHFVSAWYTWASCCWLWFLADFLKNELLYFLHANTNTHLILLWSLQIQDSSLWIGFFSVFFLLHFIHIIEGTLSPKIYRNRCFSYTD